eukprot:365664-Chlamydomonas_euryale.AAC.9
MHQAAPVGLRVGVGRVCKRFNSVGARRRRWIKAASGSGLPAGFSCRRQSDCAGGLCRWRTKFVGALSLPTSGCSSCSSRALNPQPFLAYAACQGCLGPNLCDLPLVDHWRMRHNRSSMVCQYSCIAVLTGRKFDCLPRAAQLMLNP